MNKKSLVSLVSHAAPLTGQQPKTAWLIAPPKTGSTWLSVLLRWSFRWPIDQVIPRGYARRAQEVLIPPSFRRSASNIFLPHHHTCATEPTINFIKDYHVYVILLRRNIYDTAISIVDHLTQDGVGIPVCYIPLSFKRESFETRLEIVTHLVLPWYVSFYASWAYAQVDNGIQPHFVEYEALVEDPLRELASCLTHCHEIRNVDIYNFAIKMGSQKEHTRFNKGVPGRSIQLTAAQRSVINFVATRHKDPTINSIIAPMLTYEDAKTHSSSDSSAIIPGSIPTVLPDGGAGEAAIG